MEHEYLHGRAFVKKSDGKIQIFETPYSLGDFVPVLADGTTKPRMLKDRFADVVNVRDFGAVGDGVHDDTEAIQAAGALAYLNNSAILFPGGEYLLSDSLTFKRPVETSGYVTLKAADRKDSTPPVVNLIFERQVTLDRVSFRSVNVRMSSDAAYVAMRGRLEYCLFWASTLTVGQDNDVTWGYDVSKCAFVSGLSRSDTAITVKNARNVTIRHCQIQEYGMGIAVEPSLSFAAQDIEITYNTVSNALQAVCLLGSSMNRIVNAEVSYNHLSATRRNTAIGLDIAELRATWCVNLRVKHNTITSRGEGIVVANTIGLTAVKNQVTCSDSSPIRTYGCEDVTVDDNEISSDKKEIFPFLGVAANVVQTFAPNLYKNRNWTVCRNTCRGNEKGISIRGADNVRVFGNTLIAKSSDASVGLLHLSRDNTHVAHWDNRFILPAGKPTYVGGTLGIPDSVQEEPPAEAVVQAPEITQSDASLNGAKSYLVTFTLNDYRQLRQIGGQKDVKKTLSAWCSELSSAPKLAWNSSAWDDSSGSCGDIVLDGVANDAYGIENFWWARSAVLIDNSNRLTCRLFPQRPSPSSYPLQVGACSVAERAWQTAIFRAPLVVDGKVYIDEAISKGLVTENDARVQISARTCLGQKLDGTYVLLVVDGATNVSGCTMQQVADKMLALGCIEAFNLDGGGSTTLWWNGSVINSPSDEGGERQIPTIMYVE